MTRDLTRGNPARVILQFTIPILLGLLLQQVYNLVDTMIVGKFVGVDALGGVGSTGSLNFMILGSCIGLCMGFGIPAAMPSAPGICPSCAAIWPAQSICAPFSPSRS